MHKAIPLTIAVVAAFGVSGCTKGANAAGLQVVFSNYGIDFEDIEVLSAKVDAHLKKMGFVWQ